MDLRNILNFIVIIVGGAVIAVFIGQHLQNYSEKRKDKISILRILMKVRLYCWTKDSLYVINSIDLGEKNVI